MKLQIEIPKEFEEDFESDRFKDFFKRVIADIDITGLHGNLCGNYEKETAHMFVNAFKNAKEVDGGWHIVADDDLPECEWGYENPNPVLFQISSSGTIEVGYYGCGGKWRDKYFRTYRNSGEGYDASDIITWQPLPEPYKSTT